MIGALLLKPLLNSLTFLIPILILVAVLKSPQFKGYIGEVFVRISGRRFLDKSLYTIINNVTLPTETGTTQIDHIVVSRYGVFVIETKNMKGWIFGGEHQKDWTQQIFKRTNKFQNPLHQNYKHVKTLIDLLGIDSKKLFSVVVFIGDVTFKTEMPSNVTVDKGYIQYIRSKKEILLEQAEVDSIVAVIKSGKLKQNLKTYISHAEHVKGIKEAKSNYAKSNSH